MAKATVKKVDLTGDTVSLSMSVKPSVEFSSAGFEIGCTTKLQSGENHQQALVRAEGLIVNYAHERGEDLYRLAWKEVETIKKVARDVKNGK